MSKGRRLIITAAGLVLTVACAGARLATARQDDPPPLLEEPAKDKTTKPKNGEGTGGIEIPADLAAPELLPVDEPAKADKAAPTDKRPKALPKAKSPSLVTPKGKDSAKKLKDVAAPKTPPRASGSPSLLLPIRVPATAKNDTASPATDLPVPDAPAPSLDQDDNEQAVSTGKEGGLDQSFLDPGNALRDEDVTRVQASGGGEKNPLPVAQDRSGLAGTAATGAESSGGDGFVLPVDKIPVGPQSVGLTIQVLSPATMNLKKPTRVTIVVKNNGPTDALGVVVRDKVPDGLKFLSSQPEAQPVGDIVTWHLGTVAAASERKITLNVEPVGVGPCDHCATVFLKAGARAKTVVMQPKLKVEQTVNKSKVLKGQQVRFEITVTNTGSGPARGVVVQAKLSPGLAVPGEGQVVALNFSEVLGKDALKPNESVTLSPLIADTIAGGVQTCEVDASSPDVVDDEADAHGKASVDVTEPLLRMTLKGSQTRYTDTLAEYTLAVENPGTAPALDVRVSATLQGDFRPPVVPKGAVWDSAGKRLRWVISALDPNSRPLELKFRVKMGGVQVFQVNAEALARGGLKQHATCSTQVLGNADIGLNITEGLRILDVGQETVYVIKIQNRGTKDATKILVSAKLSNNLKAGETFGTDEQAKLSPQNEVFFPFIERLAPGATLVLEMKAEARAAGLASCHVYLTHDDLQGEKIEDVVTTKITGSPPQSP